MSAVLLGLAVAVPTCTAFGLGHFLGVAESRTEVMQVRLDAARAEVRLHELTRETIARMVEHGEGMR